MTIAEVIAVMGFEGNRVDGVSADFSVSSIIYFRESPKKFISVNFNNDQRATSKNLYGIQVITLAKYESIKIEAASGTSRIEVDSIMGFDGIQSRFRVLPGNQTEYYWRAGSFHTVTVRFNAADKAIRKSLSGGFPGMVTLEKYNRINVGASRTGSSFTVTGPGTSQSAVNLIMGFSGIQRSYNSTTLISTVRWAESAEKYIEVKFLGLGASSKASSARASGLPGAVDKP